MQSDYIELCRTMFLFLEGYPDHPQLFHVMGLVANAMLKLGERNRDEGRAAEAASDKEEGKDDLALVVGVGGQSQGGSSSSVGLVEGTSTPVTSTPSPAPGIDLSSGLASGIRDCLSKPCVEQCVVETVETPQHTNDTITSLQEKDTVNNPQGNDAITSPQGKDTVTGPQGNDAVTGPQGNDAITGPQGKDTVTGPVLDSNAFEGTGNGGVIGSEAIQTCSTHAEWFITYEQFAFIIQQEPEMCQFFAEQSKLVFEGRRVDKNLDPYTRAVMASEV